MTITLRELTTDAHFTAALPLLKTLNPAMNLVLIRTRLQAMRKNGYRCLGAFAGKEIVGLCGFWVGTRIWCGTYIDLDNVVVAAAWRGRHIGERMTDWIEAEGRRLGCDVAVLDTYATYARAHKFYFARGYHIEGYHMIKELGTGKVSRLQR